MTNTPSKPPPKKRQVIQIAPVQRDLIDDCFRVYETEVQVFALCDDGTTWSIKNRTEGWTQLPPIPQDQSEDSTMKSSMQRLADIGAKK